MGWFKRQRVRVYGIVIAFFLPFVLEAVLRVQDALPVPQQYVTLNRYIPRRQRENLRRHVYLDEKVFPELPSSFQFSTDSNGFRSRPGTRDKGARGIRVVFIGGSTTEGSLLDDAVTWPAVASTLTEDLVGHGIGVADLNMGVPTTNTRDHVASIAQYVIPRLPDIIVLSVGINDLELHFHPTYNPFRQEAHSSVRFLDWVAGSDFLNHFYLLRLLRLQKDGDVDWSWTGPRVRLDAGDFVRKNRALRAKLPYKKLDVAFFPPPEFEQNLRSIVGEVMANNVRIVLMTETWLFQDVVPPETMSKFWGHETLFKYREGDLDRVLTKYNDVIRKIAREFRLPLVDLERKLPKNVDYFFDEMHFTPLGARKVAEQLAPILADLIRNKNNQASHSL
ncbi:MAG: SGNH/GDSL hydrolase family protein [Bdellovibrionales bacterium]|nr:SGNH/GDSL hydrolase family protein [Bdellovibrionales bacterium]